MNGGEWRVECFCANVLSYFRFNELSIWEVGRNLNAERKFWFVHNLQCGDCASAGGSRLRGNDGGACFDRLSNLSAV